MTDVTSVAMTDVTVRATPVRAAIRSLVQDMLDRSSDAILVELQMTIDGTGARSACNRVGRTSTSRRDVPSAGGENIIHTSWVKDGLQTLEPAPPAQTSSAMPVSTARAHATAAQLVAIPSRPLLLAAPRAASPWRLLAHSQKQ
eukprot:scaffold19910_cov70-Phaeocystis_antarctica.AAC.1